MYIKKLELDPEVKRALFNGARKNYFTVQRLVPRVKDAFYWAIGCSDRANVQQYTYEPNDGPFGERTPIMEPLPFEAWYSSLIKNDPSIEKFFTSFGLSQYHGVIYDANWGVHKHAYDVNRRFSLTLIDSESASGSIAGFWKVKGQPEADPTPNYLYGTIEMDHPGLELVHEEPIEPFEAYIINTWQWHSFITPGLKERQLAGFSPVRVLCHLLIPNDCATNDQAINFINNIESHVLR